MLLPTEKSSTSNLALPVLAGRHGNRPLHRFRDGVAAVPYAAFSFTQKKLIFVLKTAGSLFFSRWKASFSGIVIFAI